MRTCTQEKNLSSSEGITFLYEPAPELPASIIADEQRLRQVLLNLLNNAVKFTDQGRVTLRILHLGFEILDLNSSQSAIANRKSQIATIRFEAEDTGPGITTEHRENIFAPFRQVGDVRHQAKDFVLEGRLTIAHRFNGGEV